MDTCFETELLFVIGTCNGWLASDPRLKQNHLNHELPNYRTSSPPLDVSSAPGIYLLEARFSVFGLGVVRAGQADGRRLLARF